MSIQINSKMFHDGTRAKDITLASSKIVTTLMATMPLGPNGTAPQPDAYDGLIAEVVRRLVRKPTFAAADPMVLRELVLVELRKGTHTIFGLVRAVERGL